MADAQITYEQLFDTLRREKSRDELQKLDKEFYDKVRTFLSVKQDTIREAESKGMGSLTSQRAQIEYQNVKKILKELYERRERKIMTLAMHRTRTEGTLVDADALLAEEQQLLESLVHLLVQSRETTLAMVEMRSPLVVSPFAQRPESYDQDTHQPRYEDETSGPTTVNVPQAASPGVEVDAGDTYSSIESMVMVKFIAPVPKFVNKDLRVFGPYEAGQTASLPDDIASKLVAKGRAQEIDPE